MNSSLIDRSILVISDDATFVGKVLSLWGEPEASPNFKVVRSEACATQDAADFQFVLVGGVKPEICRQIVDTFRAGTTPVIVVIDDRSLQAAEANSANVVVLQELPQWHELLAVLAVEVFRRSASQAHARRLERTNQMLDCEAKLGRNLIDARHNLNNALTSVLGNAELLLLEEGKWADTERKQIETIRIMALRMHETIQRFSSLEKELRAGSGESAETETESSEQIRRTNCSVKGVEDYPRAYAQAAGAD
jgi:signal transduction histidine kinase